jgi:uncharacterized membrane protein
MRLAFAVVLYLIIDMAYVLLSKDTYASAISKVTTRTVPRNNLFRYALAAYVVLGMGWYFIAAPMAQMWAAQEGNQPILWAALAGAIYGAVLYGTFNFTVAAMFDGWSLNIIIRDMLWGISWSAISVAAYVAYTKK